jgi:hypothetical protein
VLLIGVCDGMDRPRSLGDYLKTRMGDIEWHKEMNVTIPIRRSGVAQWIVLVDGSNVRAVRLTMPSVFHEGSKAQADISKKSTPKLIGF